MKKLFCVIGDPIAHSRSPAIHTRAFELLSVDAVYAPCRVLPAQLKDAVAGLRALSAAGFNVTVPHKANVAALCDRLAREAELAGAVNCVVNEDGQLVGHNTDGTGLLRALHDRGVNVDGVRAVVLGAGGSARAAAMALAGRAFEVSVINRDASKARTLSLQLRAAGTRSESAAPNTDASRDLLSRAQLVVHCTTIGMNSSEALIDVAQLGASCSVVDLVYAGAAGTKPGETALVAGGRARGLVVIDGIDVLVHQALASLAIWLRRDSLSSLFPELRAAALAATPHAEV